MAVCQAQTSRYSVLEGVPEGALSNIAGGFLEEPADQRLLQLAFDPCRTDTARQLAHALRREHGPGTYIYSQVHPCLINCLVPTSPWSLSEVEAFSGKCQPLCVEEHPTEVVSSILKAGATRTYYHPCKHTAKGKAFPVDLHAWEWSCRRTGADAKVLLAQTCTLLRRAFNAAKREHDKALSRRQQPGFPRELLGASVAAAVPALEAIAAQLDFVRALRERHNAEHMLAVWRHNVVRAPCCYCTPE